VHCGNGFDAGFIPYQSTRLSRVLIKSLERNALHTSRIRDMVRLNGNRSKPWKDVPRGTGPADYPIYWHIADNPAATAFVRYWTNNGQRLALGHDGSVANDPTATLAVHCGNGFDTGFSPYQSTRLSRYNAVS
jgi:hypothetical protein